MASTRANTRLAAAPRTRTATVLLTGAGGIVGQGILKSLAGTPYRAMGADACELAAGLYASARGCLLPKVEDPRYLDRLLEICIAENVRYVFPGLDMELPVLARAAARFREAGVVLIVSSAEVTDLADDKLETARFLESHGFPAPRTVDLAEGEPGKLGLPVVLKPRKGGARSQGVFVVTTQEELGYRLANIDRTNYVAQEYLEGDEYSCGSVNFDGHCFGVMVMKRTLRDGDTHKAFIIREPIIESHIRRVAEILRPFGPCNFQLRLRQGTPYIFEINPRCSGGTCIRALAGFNEPLMTLDYLEHGVPPAYEIRLISVFRYWKEIVVDNDRIENARRTGIVQEAGQRL
ncbi:MAG: ATP-grasp domain-containing protein [Planctomycetes bacterium]|nr:ATP-grasp domain-containing protein [Planctomycetota bacterium]